MNHELKDLSVKLNWLIVLNALLLLAFVVSCARGASPSTELAAATRDVLELPETVRPQVRYLSLYNLDNRDGATSAVGFTLNSISRSAVMVRAVAVTPTLLRLNLLDIAPNAQDRGQWRLAWESLAGEDRYWHSRKGDSFTDGQWLDLQLARVLRQETGSNGAILRADYFVASVLAPPFYYTFTGIPATRNQWFEQIGANQAQVFSLKSTRGANLFRSGVTNHVRRLSRWPTLTGAVWNTYDSSDSRAASDAIRAPGFTRYKFEAGEHIATRPNGLHEYALFDAAGKRLNEVDPRIASDDTIHPSTALVAGISCIRCHNQNDTEYALRNFEDGTSKLLSGTAAVYATNPETAEGLRAFYQPEALQRDLAGDRTRYALAVKQATGQSVPEATKNVTELFASYVLADVTPEVALRELGVSGDFASLLPRGNQDPILFALADGIPVQRQQWEESFGDLATAAALGGRR